MANSLPGSQPRLLTLSADAADGLRDLETIVGVKQNTEASVRAAIAELVRTEGDFTAARAAKADANTALRIADSNARALIGSVRSVLAKRFGQRWNEQWVQTGFPNQSTAVPLTQDERLTLCEKLKDFFTRHPDYEVAAMDATAALAGQRSKALKDARAAAGRANFDAGTKLAARDAAATALRNSLGGLVEELGRLLAADDPRWHQFGLNMPSDPETPEAVEGVVVTPGAPGVLHLDWPDTRRAQHYNVWVQVVGVDADFRKADRRDESDATLPGLPAGATVKIKITAANDAGEGPESAVVEAKVP